MGEAGMSTSTVAILVGALLVLAGLALTAIQMVRRQPREYGQRRVTAKAGPINLSLQTTFPGLILVGLGVVLTVIVVLAG
jgi:hypothetical protein